MVCSKYQMKDQKIGAVVIARMSSTRLPGKGLIEVESKPLLKYTLERLKECGVLSAIILATSNDPSDDELEEFAKREGLPCVRGSLDDVAARFLKAMKEFNLDAAFRVNGDSPLISMDLFRSAVDLYVRRKPDLVTNIMPRHFPHGVSIELVNSECYQRVYTKIEKQEDREHVTSYLYANKESYFIINIDAEMKYPQCDLAIDTPQDLELFKCIIASMTKPHYEYSLEEVIDIYGTLVKGRFDATQVK